MTQEEKSLLLRDLCARLPYGVIVRLEYDENTSVTRELGIGSLHDIMVGNAEGKPYLRPISSMTEEELADYESLEKQCEVLPTFAYISVSKCVIFDWLNAHNFDFRNLIERGLAIAVTKENNPYKE